MFRYKVKIRNLPDRYYDLSMGNLQGIYTFLLVYSRIKTNILIDNMTIERVVVPSIEHQNIVDYNRAVDHPILDILRYYDVTYKLPNGPRIDSFLYQIRTNNVIKVYNNHRERSNRELEFMTSDVPGYLAGLLLMSNLTHLMLPNHPITTFELYNIDRPEDYELISPLLDFPLLALPTN